MHSRQSECRSRGSVARELGADGAGGSGINGMATPCPSSTPSGRSLVRNRRSRDPPRKQTGRQASQPIPPSGRNVEKGVDGEPRRTAESMG